MGSCPPRFLAMSAPCGSPLLWREHLPRLGQAHPRKAPPAGNKTPVDVVLHVVALLCGKIERAFLGESIKPDVILGRQILVGEVIEGVATYCPTHSAEFAVNGLVVPNAAELMQAASELADAC